MRNRRSANRKESTLKHWYSTFAVLVLLLGVTAAQAAEIKIGFVDVERIRRESAPAERASKQLEKEFAPRAQELQRREAQIKAMQGQLEKDAVTMSEGDRRAKEQELARMSVDFQRMQREYREDLNMRRNQELATLFERADRVIKQIADAEKFDLILQEAVFRSPRMDITDRVLKALAEGK
ncbi:MAG: OmpH family outer membrane protein [Betaproteobacteria bacterium]|nr:OmpH family outer membrane protein [Betaproteobacteria bacterium]